MQWFDAIDKDGNGQLSPRELQAALEMGHLNFSLVTVAHIIRIHDKTGSGNISFDEFGKLHEFLTNVQQRCGMPCGCCRSLPAGWSSSHQHKHRWYHPPSLPQHTMQLIIREPTA
jgi:cell division FtsZ-interacting protein ZapD